jgi:hypothetical protein
LNASSYPTGTVWAVFCRAFSRHASAGMTEALPPTTPQQLGSPHRHSPGAVVFPSVSAL